MKKEKKTKAGFDAVQSIARYRAKDHLSWQERAEKPIRHAPVNDPGEFDEFICSCNSAASPKLTAGLIRRLTEYGNSGSMSELAQLFHGMLEKDPAIAAHLQTRVLAVLSCDWAVHGPDPVKVREVTALLNKAGIHSLLRHLLDALAFGYSGAAIIWEQGGGSIRTFRKINAPNWIFDPAGNPALLPLTGRPRPLAEYHPNQFILHTHKLHSGPTQQGGLLRPLLWLYFFKHYAMRDRARSLEKYGVPFLIAKIREDDFENDEIRNSVLNSLSKVGTDGAGVITDGSELQILSAPAGRSDHQEWLEYIDRLYALLILGQTASSSDAHGFSRGQIQENVRRDILEADCRSLMETVTEQLVAPLERFRYGTDHTLEFTLDFAMPEKLDEKAEIVKILAASGFAPTAEWIEKTFDIELKKEKEQ